VIGSRPHEHGPFAGQRRDRRELPPGALRLEIMIEQTQAILDATGILALPALVRAGRGRCRGAHFGT
jgi:hypothetical protein